MVLVNTSEQDQLLRQAAVLAVERRPEACLGCGFERSCSTHGCAVMNKLILLAGGYPDAMLAVPVHPDHLPLSCYHFDIPEKAGQSTSKQA